MLLLMVLPGLRGEEVVNLTFGAIELRGRGLVIHDAKWGKDGVGLLFAPHVLSMLIMPPL
jgi:integrase